MKKNEIEALKEAFNIPEPQQKKLFVDSYNEKLKENKRKLRFPIILRYASTAALAAVIIGLWSGLNRTMDFNNEFDKSSVIMRTESTAVTYYEPTSEQDSSYYTTEPTAAENTDVPTELPGNTYEPIVTTVTDLERNEIRYTTTILTSHEVTGSLPVTTTVTVITQTPAIVTTTVKDDVHEPTITTTVTGDINYPAIVTSVTDIIAEPTITTTVTDDIEHDVAIVTTTQTPDYDDEPSDSIGLDYTVTPSVIYDKTDEYINISELEENDTNYEPEPPLTDYDVSWESMAEDSDYIIHAMIDEIIYTGIDGKPYTQENITIGSIYKGYGVLIPTDRISIYVPGGYIPADEYSEDYDLPEDTVIYDPGGNNGEQLVDNTYIFFLKSGDVTMPDGVFQLTEKTDISVFKYSGGSYVSLGNSALSFTISELKSLLT